MRGMSAETGQALEGKELLAQSIKDILMTPIGTRIHNRDYGSLVFDLMDHPGNEANKLRLFAVSVEALMRWEPRVILTRMSLVEGDFSAGQFNMDLEGITTEDIGNLAAGAFNIPLSLGA